MLEFKFKNFDKWLKEVSIENLERRLDGGVWYDLDLVKNSSISPFLTDVVVLSDTETFRGRLYNYEAYHYEVQRYDDYASELVLVSFSTYTDV